MAILTIIVIAAAVIGVFVFLFYISNSLPDRRLDMNNIPGGNKQVLTEEETKMQNDFISFLKEKNAFDGKVFLDLGNYNVNPGSKGVFKLKEGVWILYEMGGWKELKMERRFDNQKDAYKYFANLKNLSWGDSITGEE